MKRLVLRLSFAAALACGAGASASQFSVAGSGSTFTVTRDDASAAETVRYRTVSRSALAGAHFDTALGRLDFAAGQLTNRVTVAERTAAQIDDPRFTYFQSGGATGSSRAYRFEVVDDGGFVLASADRSISYDASKSVSSAAFATNSLLVVNSSGVTVTDANFTQAYHAVPLSSYFSSTVPQDYLSASGARIRMTLDLQAAEIEDGYQYVQIIADNATACDTGNDNGDVPTPQRSSYLASFEHEKSEKNTSFAKYTFPVLSAGNGCGRINKAWNDYPHDYNEIGNLCQQRFNTNCRADDGRLSLPASLSTLGIRFDASGSGGDDWTAKSVVARLQAVPAGPSLLVDPVVSASPACKGSTVAVSLAFNEIVTVSAPSFLVLSTTWGDLRYAAGSGANVLTFSGTVTAVPGTQLRVTGLSGSAVQGLAGDAFSWSGTLAVSGRTVDSPSAPPRDAAGFYLLSTPAHLCWFADRIASYPQTSAALACDIDLSAAGSFSAMGGADGFMGVFDGRGHALSGLNVSSPDSSGASPARLGLFGQIAAQGVVSNLVLSGATVSAPASPALVGAVCGRNLGTIDHCSVSGGVLSTGPYQGDGAGSALGGVCGENAGAVRACRVVGPLASSGAVLYNRVSNDAVGGIAGVNAAAGTLEACYFHAGFSDVTRMNITRGAVCGSNAGTVRNCVGVHHDNNYFGGCIGSNAGTADNVPFLDVGAPFSGGAACYALDGGVTDGSQPWYQALGADDLSLFAGPTVHLHGSEGYVNTIEHVWIVSFEHSPDYSNGVWTATCSFCDETATLATNGTAEATTQPTCTEPGQTTWTYVMPANGYIAVAVTNTAVQPGVPPALGHDWGAPEYLWTADGTSCTASRTCDRCGATTNETVAPTLVPDLSFAPGCTAPGTNTYAVAFSSPLFAPQTNAFEVAALGHDWTAPVWTWNADYTAATAAFACSRGDAEETVAAAVERVPGDGDVTNCTATATHHGETFTDSVTILPPVSYVGADGVERQCFLYTVLVPSQNIYGERGAENWYVVTNDIAYTRGSLRFKDDHARLILRDGATLTANANVSYAISADVSLTIYGQSGGTGAISASADINAIYARGCITVNGGVVEATTPNPNTYYGISADRTATINGGVVRGSVRGGYGLAVNGGMVESSKLGTYNGYDIVLGWRNATDSITAAAYVARSISVNAGQSLTDGTVVYQGAVDPADIAGKTLRPCLSWEQLQAMFDAGGAVTLPGDVTAAAVDATLLVTNAVTLDLNGHMIDADRRFGAIRVIAGGDLMLTNGVPGSGAVTGGSTLDGGGVCAESGGAFTMAGGAISGNTAEWDGGGVYMYDGTFTMTGGTISGNAARYGGGVYVNGGAFTMTGGEISDNTAEDSGGGVYVQGTFTMTDGTISGNEAYCIGGSRICGGGGVCVNGGTFAMTNGAISGNVAHCTGESGYGGGGVYVNNGGAFEMSDSAVSGNAAGNGGGVFVNNGTFKVSGVSTVSGNTNAVGAAANVYLPSGKEIAVDGLSSDASIGVTTADTPTASSPVAFATDAAAGDEAHFFSDDPSCRIGFENGTLRLFRGTAYPAYLAGADECVTNNWLAWAGRHGAVTNDEFEAAFLLDVAPADLATCTGALLRVSAFAPTEAGARLELACDIPGYRFFQPEGDDVTVLGNGYVGLAVARDLAAFAGETRPIPVLATIDAATGRAVLDLDFGLYLQALGAPPDSRRPSRTPSSPVRSSPRSARTSRSSSSSSPSPSPRRRAPGVLKPRSLRNAILAETLPASHAAPRRCGEAFPPRPVGRALRASRSAAPAPLRRGSHGVLAPPTPPGRKPVPAGLGRPLPARRFFSRARVARAGERVYNAANSGKTGRSAFTPNRTAT